MGGLMGWLLLFAAGCSEIIFALSLKYNEGFSKLWPSVVTCFSGAGSFYLLMLSLKTLPLGTAYAVWTGMGAVGVAIIGIFLFKESADWIRLASIMMIILGIVGLKLTHVE
jgi:quaternary ammonium compound-resistance protein SugE